jgi:hypothetical protein
MVGRTHGSLLPDRTPLAIYTGTPPTASRPSRHTLVSDRTRSVDGCTPSIQAPAPCPVQSPASPDERFLGMGCRWIRTGFACISG